MVGEKNKEDTFTYIRNLKSSTSVDHSNIVKTRKAYYEQLYAYKFDNLDVFTDVYKVQKHLLEEITWIIYSLKKEFIVKNILIIKIPHLNNFTGEFHQIIKAEIISALHKFFHRKWEKWLLSNHFLQPVITLILKPKTLLGNKLETNMSHVHIWNYHRNVYCHFSKWLLSLSQNMYCHPGKDLRDANLNEIFLASHMLNLFCSV